MSGQKSDPHCDSDRQVFKMGQHPVFLTVHGDKSDLRALCFNSALLLRMNTFLYSKSKAEMN